MMESVIYNFHCLKPYFLVLFNPNACKLRFTYQTYLVHQAQSNLSSFSKFLAYQNTCLPIVTSLALSTPTKDVSIQPRHVPIHLLTHLPIYTSLALSTPTKAVSVQPRHFTTHPVTHQPIYTSLDLSTPAKAINTYQGHFSTNKTSQNTPTHLVTYPHQPSPINPNQGYQHLPRTTQYKQNISKHTYAPSNLPTPA